MSLRVFLWGFLALACTTSPAGRAKLGPAATASSASAALPPISPPVEGAVTTRRYRNLFAERGHGTAEIDQKIERAWAQLFHGDPANESVYYAAGENAAGPLAYIADIGNDDVRSEGMSYGMMIAVQLDHQAEFRALWNWAKTYMQNRERTHPAYGYFAWQLKRTGEHLDDMPAPDGEEYFATALLFAATRWGSGQGIYDYRREADELLDTIKNRADITGVVNGKKTTTGSSLFDRTAKMVRFSPDHGSFVAKGHTNPSYHLPAFYEIWARVGPEPDRAFWRDAAATSRDFLYQAAHAKTGLTPDYAHYDGTPLAASWDANSVRFRFDAWRTAMNWSMDYAWWAADPRQKELCDRIQAFFAAQGIAGYGNNFTLEGEPTSHDHSLGLVATNAVASLAATNPRAWLFVDELWKQAPPTGKWRYYDGLLYLMGLLHASGNFRVYLPG
jgi:oligosaccharide reducing-end xylanase